MDGKPSVMLSRLIGNPLRQRIVRVAVEVHNNKESGHDK
jgi:hypothetical protein